MVRCVGMEVRRASATYIPSRPHCHPTLQVWQVDVRVSGSDETDSRTRKPAKKF